MADPLWPAICARQMAITSASCNSIEAICRRESHRRPTRRSRCSNRSTPGRRRSATATVSSRGYRERSPPRNLRPTIGSTPVTSGMMAACFQFGPAICNNDVAALRSGQPCGGANPVNINSVPRNPGSATTDGNGQTICSWGGNIQANINVAAATCKNGSGDCAPVQPDRLSHAAGVLAFRHRRLRETNNGSDDDAICRQRLTPPVALGPHCEGRRVAAMRRPLRPSLIVPQAGSPLRPGTSGRKTAKPCDLRRPILHSGNHFHEIPGGREGRLRRSVAILSRCAGSRYKASMRARRASRPAPCYPRGLLGPYWRRDA